MDMHAAFAGDEVVPNADMIYNNTVTVHATPEEVHPWLVQIGKGRGGWYLTSWAEQLLPRSWHASRRIEDKWQALEPGDRVEDYGFDAKQDFFIVASNTPPKALVFKSDRYGCSFSWALLSHKVPGRTQETIIHLRFRGKIQSTGLKRWVIATGGEFMDWISVRPLLAGLKERVEKYHAS